MKIRVTKRCLCLVLAGTLFLTVLSGCGNTTKAGLNTADVSAAQVPTPEESPKPLPTPVPTPAPPTPRLSAKQQSSIAMLNYLTVLVQEIRDARNNRVYLESAYSELINNTEPSIVDEQTLQEYESLLSEIDSYRLNALKRERLQYIYQQNCAHAIRASLRGPSGSTKLGASSGDLLPTVAVLLGQMALNSYTSYSAYTKELEEQYLQAQQELDDAEEENLHRSRAGMFSYMVRVAREQRLPAGYTLNEEAVADFVEWRNNDNPASRIRWLEAHKETYAHFGEYWLALADAYYECGRYESCLEAIGVYESLDNSIFRMDHRLAQTLPKMISAARETLSGAACVAEMDRLAGLLVRNTGCKDWALRCFAAQTYRELYEKTASEAYLRTAFDLIFDNVNELVPEQHKLNSRYLAAVAEVPVDKNAAKEEQKAVKAYNAALRKERKTALPPVYEPLLLNCELLTVLADELELDEAARREIDAILHPNGRTLFLGVPLDEKFTFSPHETAELTEAEVSYESGMTGTQQLKLPAAYLEEGCEVSAVIRQGETETPLGPWEVAEVNRGKTQELSQFTATLTCKPAEKLTFREGDMVEVTVFLPGCSGEEPSASDALVFLFTAEKADSLLPGLTFRRLF